jgi:hypothetical protein
MHHNQTIMGSIQINRQLHLFFLCLPQWLIAQLILFLQIYFSKIVLLGD